MSSARGPEANSEEAFDDLEDSIVDLEDYTEAAHENPNAEIEGGESDANLNSNFEENDDFFNLVGGCFRTDGTNEECGRFGIGSEDGLVGLEKNTKRLEKVSGDAIISQNTVLPNFSSRA
ncbi:hypothetical protein LINPERPRIM_LOCUS30367, partial [Linum perenne]